MGVCAGFGLLKLGDEGFGVHSQKGFSLIELLIVVAIILIIAAIAIPSLLRARMSANDSAAASTLRIINTSQATYLINYSSFGYAAGLATLSGGAGAGVDCTIATNVGPASACLIDKVVGCSDPGPCQKNQYFYMYTPGALVNGMPSDYTAYAAPVGWQISGTKNWCTNSDAVIRNVGPTTAPNAMNQAQAPGLTATACQTTYNPANQ